MIFDSLIYYYQRRKLRQLSSAPRTKRIANLKEVRTIGIIFTVGKEEAWGVIHNFVRLMEQQGKQLWLIGFQTKDMVIPYIFTHAHTTICREKEDLNTWRCPKATSLEPFLEQPYDLLIDTTAEPNLWALYTAAATQAALKVAYATPTPTEDTPFPEWKDLFDLLIEDKSPLNVEHFLSEVVRYLNMIQK